MEEPNRRHICNACKRVKVEYKLFRTIPSNTPKVSMWLCIDAIDCVDYICKEGIYSI